jgi:hypothetical protein
MKQRTRIRRMKANYPWWIYTTQQRKMRADKVKLSAALREVYERARA